MQHPSPSPPSPPHQAHYQSPPPDIKLSTRARRRSRTTPAQIAVLEDYFNNVTNKPTRDVCREQLAPQVNISGDSVYFWFQNRRSKMAREQRTQRRHGRSESPPRRPRVRRSNSTSALTSHRHTAVTAPITREVLSQSQQLQLQYTSVLQRSPEQRQQIISYPSSSSNTPSNAAAADLSQPASLRTESYIPKTASVFTTSGISFPSGFSPPATTEDIALTMSRSTQQQQHHTRLPPLSTLVSSSGSNSGGQAFSGPGSAFTPTAAAAASSSTMSTMGIATTTASGGDIGISSGIAAHPSAMRETPQRYHSSHQQRQQQESQESAITMGSVTSSHYAPTVTTLPQQTNIQVPGTAEMPPIPFYFHHSEFGTEASMLHYLYNQEVQEHQQQQHPTMDRDPEQHFQDSPPESHS